MPAKGQKTFVLNWHCSKFFSNQLEDNVPCAHNILVVDTDKFIRLIHLRGTGKVIWWTPSVHFSLGGTFDGRTLEFNVYYESA